MSALRAQVNEEAEEKRHTTTSESTSSEAAVTQSEASSRTNEDADSKCTQSRKHKLSPDRERVSKVARHDTDRDISANSSVPSDLTTSGNSRKDSDASEPNKIIDNTSLVAEHYNALEEKGLRHRNQSRIVYMRNFNNWIKSMLINEYISKVRQNKNHGASLRVLDMCCGKGGDLFKWKKTNITHLICADIAEVSLEQCQQRYNDMSSRSPNDRGFAPIYTAEFITADCTKVRLREKYKDPSMQLDFVSCQFAFHYSFESLSQAECMLRNASETLRPGGYFVGTIPDAYDLVSRWQQCDGNKFGNDVYSIEFLCDKERPPLFGAKYNFHLEGVVDCPEFLVHLPTLRKLALKNGLELVSFERFDTFYERFKDEGRSLLGNMQALETYPPFHEVPLLGNPEQDYQHAVQYMQNLPDHRKIGTLSQSEWDATSLYAVFAFRKMKTVWNSEGKPEYVA
ncbi:PREDICTED: mRNA cap guanine-N7 methyltransferase isoform X2 [Dinoponera quadriceps]|uniref:mRNA cap guanine-N(7) methyltransferase n=1 Tax=Dinoponera quadriceps TaxID=609295 RepID=A0A6P3X0M0_DINQU|nr:PREDICTED: mRNA cap guanine-N7 methyltransferase isoform X2 [Dinoponera quadriceps]